MNKSDIKTTKEARLEDAQALYDAGRYDGSVYLCGYSIELGLKEKICSTLNWTEYPTGRDYRTFKTHDLDVLLHLSGVEGEIKLNHFADWSIVNQWNPEARYNPVGKADQNDAQEMLEASRAILEQL